MAQCKQFTCSVTSHPKGNSPSDYRHCVPLVNFICLTTVPVWLARILIRHLLTVLHVQAHSATLLCITKDSWNIFSSLFN